MSDLGPLAAAPSGAAGLRAVDLRGLAPGRLFLSALPGRHGDAAAAMEVCIRAGVQVILCLVSGAEAARLAPGYARLWGTPSMPTLLHHPVPDFAAPPDAQAFAVTVTALAARLRAGEAALIHCAAGIGRTGTAAISVLHALGLDADEAAARVRAAGSGPESAAQRAFLAALSETRPGASADGRPGSGSTGN